MKIRILFLFIYFNLLLIIYGTDFRICVASFKKEENAKIAISKLSKEGFNSYIEKANINGEIFYRVFLKNKFATYKEASNSLQKLKNIFIKYGYKTPWVVSPKTTSSNQSSKSNSEQQNTTKQERPIEKFVLPDIEETNASLKKQNEELKTSEKELKNQIKINYNEKLEINKTNKEYLLLKLKLYKEEFGKLPEKEEEFANYIENPPIEIFSGMSRITFENDLLGGWFIDTKNINVKENIDDKLIK